MPKDNRASCGHCGHPLQAHALFYDKRTGETTVCIDCPGDQHMHDFVPEAEVCGVP